VSDTEETVDELPSPGWQAIDDALARVYGDQQPRHVGYQPPAAFSHNLQGCSAYRAEDHWHFVSYGLSELYVPAPDDDPEYSGWGFELTIRVAGGGDAAPEWPFTMVNEIAKYVRSKGVVLVAGERIGLGSPVTGFPHLADAPETGLTVFALTVDPVLGEIETPNGRVQFLQLVGVTEQEKQEMLTSGTARVLASLAAGNPLLVTDPARA